ncbi:unnamed protein product [Cunninghamella blakesleeana]
MIIKVLLYGNLLLLYHIVFVLCDIQGRLQPGCSLIQSTLYCFGGYRKIKNGSYYYTHPINEHISLDLTTFNDFKTLNTSEIKWKNVSNSLNKNKIKKLGNIATVGLTDHTYLLYGGSNHIKSQLLSSDDHLSSSFIHYDPEKNHWNSISLYKTTHRNRKYYNIRPDLVNFGNNTIWYWGNSALKNDSSIFYLYNYPLSKWYFQGITDHFLRYDHSTTYIKTNGLIYIMGGYSLKESSLVSVDFHTILIFNTTSLNWSTFNASGEIPSNRGAHTAIESSNQSHILIYGGSLISTNEVIVSQDVYYVYDIFNNNFTKVSFHINESGRVNTRFAHFATLYQSNYLLLVFGFQDKDRPSDSLNVIDVSDVYKPIWITSQMQTPTSSSIPSTPTSTNTNNNKNSNISLEGEKLEKTIISVSVIAGIAIFAGIFFFIRYKKRKQRIHAPVEEQTLDDHLTIDSFQNEKIKTYRPTTSNNHQGGRMELSSN